MNKEKDDLLNPINKYKEYLENQGVNPEKMVQSRKAKKKAKGSIIAGGVVIAGILCCILGIGGVDNAGDAAKTQIVQANTIEGVVDNQEYNEPVIEVKPEVSEVKQTQQNETQSIPKETINQTPAANNQSKMVWLSTTGSKYHSKPNCGNMNPDKAIQVTEEEAKKAGKEACSNCW